MDVTLRKLSGGFIALLVILVGLVVLFSGPMSELVANALAAVLSPLPASTMQLLAAGGLLGLGILYFWEGREAPDRWTPLVDTSPERPRNAPHIVGEAFDTELQTAQSDIRLEDVAYNETPAYQQLRDTLHNSLRIAQECSDETATQRIDHGEWTNDPVAAAFLGDKPEYPTRYQLFKWARPADAFERAVERTSRAVDRFVHDEVPGTTSPPIDGDAIDSTPSWFERVRGEQAGLSDGPQSERGTDSSSGATDAAERDDSQRDTTDRDESSPTPDATDDHSRPADAQTRVVDSEVND